MFGRRHGLTQHEHSSRHVSASQPVLFGLRFFFFFFLSFRSATSGFFLSAESPHRSSRGDAAMRFASPTPISSARSRDALFVIRVSSTKKKTSIVFALHASSRRRLRASRLRLCTTATRLHVALNALMRMAKSSWSSCCGQYGSFARCPTRPQAWHRSLLERGIGQSTL